ncbi:MAG: hypothetical protein Tsb002_05480 [Wenzhouxiangellaceae bacterium]
MNDVGESGAFATDLVRRIQAGDRQAEHELVIRYSEKITFILRRYSRDPALIPDLCQDALITGLEKIRAGEIRDPSKLGAYLHQIAVNLSTAEARTYIRRNTHPDWEMIDRCMSDHPSVLENIEQEQLSKIIRRLLKSLRQPRDQQILRRYYLTEEPKDSICASLGVDRTHFDRVLHRARKRFRKLLEKNLGESFDDQ